MCDSKQGHLLPARCFRKFRDTEARPDDLHVVQDPWGRNTKLFCSVDITDLTMDWSPPNGAGQEGEPWEKLR